MTNSEYRVGLKLFRRKRALYFLSRGAMIHSQSVLTELNFDDTAL